MMKIVVALLVVVSSSAAMAQAGPLTPAPVPGVERDTYSPADRAGRSNSSDNAAPFAGVPTGIVVSEPTTAQTVPSTQRDASPTPSLSR